MMESDLPSVELLSRDDDGGASCEPRLGGGGGEFYFVPNPPSFHLIIRRLEAGRGFAMSAPKGFRALTVRLVSRSRSNGSLYRRHRTMATVAADSPTLPLAGIRVLDMTRVLAGVCFRAHLYLENIS